MSNAQTQRVSGLDQPAATAAIPFARPVSRSGSPSSAILRVPLLWKLVGTNVLVAAVAASSLLLLDRRRDVDSLFVGAIISLLVSLIVSGMLMSFALQPLGRLRTVMSRVARGELGVRIPHSIVADADLMRVGDTVNALLDELVVERARIRQLARDTIRSADEERARIARGLHDSTAQTLAALSLEARMALQQGASSELTQQLELIKDLAIDALEEVRDLSHTIHPRVLDDLGLAPALGWLARTTMESTGLQTSVRLMGDTSGVPLDVSCALFRIAESALAEAARVDARTANLHLTSGPRRVQLEVSWSGAAPDGATGKLAALRERLALASGTLTIDDRGGRGARVHAVVPLGAEIT